MSLSKNESPKYEKLPDIIQYKKLPEDFNDISLNARFQLNQIYSLLTKRGNNVPKYEQQYQDEEDKDINENQKINQEKNLFSNSEQTLIKIKKIQSLQKNKILQNKGFQNFIHSNIENYEKIKETIKKMDDKINTSNYKELNNLRKLKHKSQRMILPKIKIINDETKNENSENTKVKVITVCKIKNINNCKKKLLRSKSDTCCLYLDTPLSPKSIDDNIKFTNKGGGLIYPNSIWRSKNINDIVSNYNSQNLLDKIQQMKNERYKVIHNKDFYYYIENK